MLIVFHNTIVRVVDFGVYTPKVALKSIPVQHSQQQHIAKAYAENQIDAHELLIRVDLLLSQQILIELALRYLCKRVVVADAINLAFHQRQTIFVTELQHIGAREVYGGGLLVEYFADAHVELDDLVTVFREQRFRLRR